MNTQTYSFGDLLREIYITPKKKDISKPIQELFNDIESQNIQLEGYAENGDSEFDDEELFLENFKLACKKLELVQITEQDFPKIREAFENQDWIKTYSVKGAYSYDIGAYEEFYVEYDFQYSAMRQFDQIFDECFMEDFWEKIANLID